MRLLLPLLALLFVVADHSFAQTSAIFKPDSIKKELNAIRIQSFPKIDGVLNEPEWQLAPLSPSFTQVEPHQGQPAVSQTLVKVMYNKQNLYIGAFMKDSLGKKAIRATDFKRDFDWRSHDVLNIGFDGFNDQRNSMSFATNPYGVQRDYLGFDALYFDIDWDALWKVRTTRTDSGWYAEIQIPWQTLRYKKDIDSIQHWGINIYRSRRASNELSAFSPFPRAYSASRMDYAGLLKNIQPPPPSSNIRIQPYVLGMNDRYYGTAPLKEDKQKLKFGGDIKWAINPNTVLDITANTDFAQADADLRVNNSTRFSVFFPEKRQFFLENASLFSPGVQQATDGSGGQMQTQPFFSRSIGLDDAGTPIPIIGGGRFVHRSVKQNYGALVMRQNSSEGSPVTDFFVGRYSRNLGAQSRFGGLLSVKNSSLSTNITGTVDGFFRIGAAQSFNSMLTFTNTSAGNKQGVSGFVQYVNNTNHYKIWVTQSVVTKDYDPQMGFISRKDVIGTTPGINWYYRGRWLPFKKFIRAFEPGVMPEFYFQASTGKYIEQSLYLWPFWLNLQNGGYLGYSISPVMQRLTEPFQPLGVTITPGTYRYLVQEAWAGTDPSKVISLIATYRWGEYYDGHMRSSSIKLQIAPIPHISILAQFNRNHLAQVGDLAGTKNVDLYIIQGRFALNPRLQLIGFYQNNSLDHTQAYNIRFSWEYKPLSFLYLIYNHRAISDPLRFVKQSEDHVMAKISYLRQL
ncbi:MAG TPA: DUF5916 domain-containing protein [Flavihumibacter sp.]|nr:DUF5916 domain-containing protein [Flavihumibacter sp.]HQD08413.1 DUF5916 domain-containing protein [Flavihumibacter sp.]